MATASDRLTLDRFAQSEDGTAIHLRQSGAGPGLVLLHGGLQTSGSLSRLASELSDSFTVYAVDRRGRRPSGPFGDGYSMRKEVDDLCAVLNETGARCVFGLSSGALISMRTALENRRIAKLALYEPPMEIAGADSSPLDCVPLYEKAIASGNLAGALVASLKGIDDPRSLMVSVPGFVLEPVFRLFMDKNAPDTDLPMAELIPTMGYDMRIAREMARTAEQFSTLQADVLLLAATGAGLSSPPR